MKKLIILLISAFFSLTSQAGSITVTLHSTANLQEIGQIEFKDSDLGLLIVPNLHSLPAGLHGFHLHEHPNCDSHGNSAGSHFDPLKTNTHLGPYQKGHLGDLPVLYASEDGQANTPLLAPRLKTTDLKALAVMIHAGADNYSDTPPLGGGGERIACGVVKF